MTNKQLRLVAFIGFIINTVIIFALPALIMNHTPGHGQVSHLASNAELYVTSFGLGLLSINVFCCGIIFAHRDE